jgi:hypothetical protein
MRRYRSRLQQAISGHRTDDPESSLLPTLTACSYGSNKGGQKPGHARHSLQSLAKQGLLPTLTATGNLVAPSMWYMAFPVGWTEPVIGSPRSATRARHRKPKSSAT